MAFVAMRQPLCGSTFGSHSTIQSHRHPSHVHRGYPIFKEAFENLLERRMTMELSMTIALIAALSIGQAFTALLITTFVLAAEVLEHLLEHLIVSRGREAIGDLLRYLPRSAIMRRDGAIRKILSGPVGRSPDCPARSSSVDGLLGRPVRTFLWFSGRRQSGALPIFEPIARAIDGDRCCVVQ
jgi:hypothetical protein